MLASATRARISLLRYTAVPRKDFPMRRLLLSAAILLLAGLPVLSQDSRPPKPSSGQSDFKIGGAVGTPLDLTAADLKAMPRKTLRVDNAHSQKTEVYEGVLVADLLQKAGVPQGEQ